MPERTRPYPNASNCIQLRPTAFVCDRQQLNAPETVRWYPTAHNRAQLQPKKVGRYRRCLTGRRAARAPWRGCGTLRPCATWPSTSPTPLAHLPARAMHRFQASTLPYRGCISHLAKDGNPTGGGGVSCRSVEGLEVWVNFGCGRRETLLIMTLGHPFTHQQFYHPCTKYQTSETSQTMMMSQSRCATSVPNFSKCRSRGSCLIAIHGLLLKTLKY